MSDKTNIRFVSGKPKLSALEPGIQMWAVALEHTMLTYFEVAPRKRFEEHRHESEQITLVLEGTLMFEMDDEVHRLGPGDAIAIPSNVPHAVYTLDKPVTAVDAWSPVMASYVEARNDKPDRSSR